MSTLLIGGVVGGYLATLVGLHRRALALERRRTAGFVALEWLDWDVLLGGEPQSADRSPGDWAADGSPAPASLPRGEGPPTGLKDALTWSLVYEASPRRPTAQDYRAAQLLPNEGDWLDLLYMARQQPREALERIGRRRATTAAEAYLAAQLELRCRITPWNLEWRGYAVHRALSQALLQFGAVPCLYFARARASALLGRTTAAIDDLARAVYFSGRSRFYREAVAQSQFLKDDRPTLWLQCKSD